MTTVERTVSIDAPAEAVWDVLGRLGAISSWAPNVDHSCVLSSGPDGPGAVRRIQSGRMTVLETVEEWEPNSVLAYRITGLPPVVRTLRNSWRIHDEGGSTDVDLTTTIDAGPRPLQLLVAEVVGRRLATASEQMLAGLKAAAEGRAHD